MPSPALGLGLLSIGRRWGVRDVAPPDARTAFELIRTAFDHGIRFFDTAPAYGLSEERFGAALTKDPDINFHSIIATKTGEYWNDDDHSTWVSHSYDDMLGSVKKSLAQLGRIDLLQIHKASIDVVTSTDVRALRAEVEKFGIKFFGASVSDLETGFAVCRSGLYTHVQFPFNLNKRDLEPLFSVAADYGVTSIVNRPFAMGALAEGHDPRGCFDFIKARVTQADIILTGTSNPAHLIANVNAFS